MRIQVLVLACLAVSALAFERELTNTAAALFSGRSVPAPVSQSSDDWPEYLLHELHERHSPREVEAFGDWTYCVTAPDAITFDCLEEHSDAFSTAEVFVRRFAQGGDCDAAEQASRVFTLSRRLQGVYIVLEYASYQSGGAGEVRIDVTIAEEDGTLDRVFSRTLDSNTNADVEVIDLTERTLTAGQRIMLQTFTGATGVADCEVAVIGVMSIIQDRVTGLPAFSRSAASFSTGSARARSWARGYLDGDRFVAFSDLHNELDEDQVSVLPMWFDGTFSTSAPFPLTSALRLRPYEGSPVEKRDPLPAEVFALEHEHVGEAGIIDMDISLDIGTGSDVLLEVFVNGDLATSQELAAGQLHQWGVLGMSVVTGTKIRVVIYSLGGSPPLITPLITTRPARFSTLDQTSEIVLYDSHELLYNVAGFTIDRHLLVAIKDEDGNFLTYDNALDSTVGLFNFVPHHIFPNRREIQLRLVGVDTFAEYVTKHFLVVNPNNPISVD